MREHTLATQWTVVLNAQSSEGQLAERNSKQIIQQVFHNNPFFLRIKLHQRLHKTYLLFVWVGKQKCPQTYPIRGAEIDSFSKVVTIVEPCMVSSWEGYDKLSCMLICAENLEKKKASHLKTKLLFLFWCRKLSFQSTLNTAQCLPQCWQRRLSKQRKSKQNQNSKQTLFQMVQTRTITTFTWATTTKEKYSPSVHIHHYLSGKRR